MEELLRVAAKVINTKFNNTISFQDMEGTEKDMEGIKRPSFLIYFVSGTNTDVNYFCTKDNMIIQIVYFAKLLKGKLPDRVMQSSVICTVKKAFNDKMVLNAGDCIAKIQQINIGYTADEDIFLQLHMDIYSARNIPDYPLMESISLNNEEV